MQTVLNQLTRVLHQILTAMIAKRIYVVQNGFGLRNIVPRIGKPFPKECVNEIEYVYKDGCLQSR